ncbi:MAG: 6-bladed beta-propeller [Bacteroidota bacterium]
MNNKTVFPGVILFLLSVFLFSSCWNKITKEDGTASIIIFPPPPDTTRIQFLTKISNSADVTGTRTAFAKLVFGNADEALTFSKPYGVAMHKGKLYVCDNPIHGLEIIDFENNSFDYFIPTGKGQLQMPLNCDVDDNGYIYVADALRMQIIVFDEKGDYITCFGEKENFKPTDVYVKDNKIWVVNLAGHKINVYSKDSTDKLLFSFPDSKDGKEEYLYSPTNICVTDDKVYVTDVGACKIKTYSHKGIYLNSVGSTGKGLGQFVRPKGIAVDRDSNLYVVDASFENVQIFNSKGQLLMFFGGAYTGSGYMCLPSKVIIDYDNISYFQQYVDPSFTLKYLIIVVNQYGPDKINIYGYVEPAKAGLTPENNNGNK